MIYAVIWSFCALIASAYAVYTARQAKRIAEEADKRSKSTAGEVLTNSFTSQTLKPNREEQVSHHRATITACRIAEDVLGDHIHELPAAILLTNHRSAAAHAVAELRNLGIEL